MPQAVAAGEKTAHGVGGADDGGESVNDRNAAIKALERAWNYLDVQNRTFKAVVLKCNGVYDGVTVFDETLDGIKDALALLKAQDDSTVIKCKDCDNWERDWTPTGLHTNGVEVHYCPYVDRYPSAEWFCADAERRCDPC